MSRKVWVVITGGIQGILTIRLVVGQLLALVREYPAIVDGAYVIVAWVGVKLVIHYAHTQHWLPFEIPSWLSIGVSIALFIASVFYARMRHGPGPGPPPGKAEVLLDETKQKDDSTP
jgi:predicted tellurium resistance membrane protein TerC